MAEIEGEDRLMRSLPSVEREQLRAELERLGVRGPRVDNALDLAVRAHLAQRRAGGGPYLEQHVYPVTLEATRYLTARALPGPDLETAAITALLHDTVEDVDWVTPETIQSGFGAVVARQVAALTKPAKLTGVPGDELAYLSGVRRGGFPVLAIKVFDRLNNLAGIHLRPLPQRREYLAETREHYLSLAREVDPDLAERMAQLVAWQESRLPGTEAS